MGSGSSSVDEDSEVTMYQNVKRNSTYQVVALRVLDKETPEVVSEIGRQNGNSSNSVVPGKLTYLSELSLNFRSSISSGAFGYSGYVRFSSGFMAHSLSSVLCSMTISILGTKCNRQNCGADKPSDTKKSPSEPVDDNDQCSGSSYGADNAMQDENSRHCFILSLVAVLSLSVIDVSLGARHLLQTSVPILPTIPTLPKVSLPPLPTMPTLPRVGGLPPLPATSLPTLPTIPTLPTMPTTIPKVALPPLPASFPTIPNINIPTTFPSIPFFSPPPSTNSP
ncbi:hypothetical protein ACET3Z_010393 [Daucus carota]